MRTAPSSDFPATLRAATPAEGQEIARRLAARALEERTHATRTIADHLSTPATPSLEALTAAYFQAVAAANRGWHD